jgi:hypothetical protein
MDATFLFEVFQVTFCVVGDSFRMKFCPFRTVFLLKESFGLSTLTWQVYFCFPMVPIISVDPFSFAFTTPFLLTVAMSALALDHITFFFVFFNFSFTVSPFSIVPSRWRDGQP